MISLKTLALPVWRPSYHLLKESRCLSHRTPWVRRSSSTTSRSNLSTQAALLERSDDKDNASNTATLPDLADRPFRRYSTPTLLRTILLSRIFQSRILSQWGMAVLRQVADSRAAVLDPDRNPVLNRILRTIIYNQFCVGSEASEIRRGVQRIKDHGFDGVILNYARELVAHDMAVSESTVDISAQQIKHWLDGNLKTLSYLKSSDFLGLKYTGAGGSIAEALRNGKDPPPAFWDALMQICDQAQAQGTPILLDAEQQVYQPTIDRWTLDIMRKYNRSGGDNALILNTYQSYLKSTRSNIRLHLELAAKEGWTFGIKLVRGAYMLNEDRWKIHDTKADTDACYNGIVRDLMKKDFDGLSAKQGTFPAVRLFVGSHNRESIHRACELHESMVSSGERPAVLELGQLWGMADHVSGELLTRIDAMRGDGTEPPRAFKVANWGTVRESLHFLMRRAAENQGALERLQDGLAEARKELYLRLTLKG